MGAIHGLKIKDIVAEALVLMEDKRWQSYRGPFTCLALADAWESMTGYYPGIYGSAVSTAWGDFNTIPPDELGGNKPEWWNHASQEANAARKAALQRWADEHGEEVIY